MFKGVSLGIALAACGGGNKGFRPDLSPVAISPQEQTQCNALREVLGASSRAFSAQTPTLFGAARPCTYSETPDREPTLVCQVEASETAMLHVLRGCLAGWETLGIDNSDSTLGPSRYYDWTGDAVPSADGGVPTPVAFGITMRARLYWSPDEVSLILTGLPGPSTPPADPKPVEPTPVEPPPVEQKQLDLEPTVLAAIDAYPDQFASVRGPIRKDGDRFDKMWEATVCVKSVESCYIGTFFGMKRHKSPAFNILVYSGTDARIVNAAYDVVEKKLLAMTFPFETVTLPSGTQLDRFRLWQPKPTSNPDATWKGLTIELVIAPYLTGELAPKPTMGHSVYVRIVNN